MNRREIGAKGEQLAREFLKKQGCRILTTNYRCRHGEIDIIALQGEYLLFIEVRTKTGLNYGTPEESITFSKMQHLEKAAYHYQMTHHPLPSAWRIDLIAIELDENLKCRRLEVVRNVLEE